MIALFALAAATFGLPPEERGVALGLFSADPKYSYRQLLEEVKATGATHVSISWVWWQENASSNRITRVEGWTATDEQIVDSIKIARELGLEVMAFPILRFTHPRARDEWRGKIAPENEDAWWQSYTEMIMTAAELAKKGGAEQLSIGSELLSRERMRGRWAALIDRVRVEAPELELCYSANWDHYTEVSFWDLVDVVGMTMYFELTRSTEAEVRDLVLSWMGIKTIIGEFSARIGRKIVVTEIGYPSLDGAVMYPWDETRKAAIDLEEQRRAYEAFVHTWSDVPFLRGVYWWNWFGFGGATDGNYTPRNKPAADVLRSWYRRVPM